MKSGNGPLRWVVAGNKEINDAAGTGGLEERETDGDTVTPV